MWYILSFLAGCFLVKTASKKTEEDLRKTAIYLAFIKSSKAELTQLIIKEIKRLYLEGKLEDVIYNGTTYKFTPSDEMIEAFHTRNGNLNDLLK